MKRTYGVSLNTRNEVEAALLAKLESAGNQSDLIKRALIAYFDGGNQPPAITEQEASALRARIAYLEQESAPVAVPQSPPPAGQGGAVGMFAGAPLSESFKAAVAKAARPGLRLEQL